MGNTLDVNDIAECLKVSVNTARKLMEQMRPIDVSTSNKKRQLRVLQSEFDAWLRKRQALIAEPKPEMKRRRKAAQAPNAYMDEFGRPYVRRNGQLVPMVSKKKTPAIRPA